MRVSGPTFWNFGFALLGLLIGAAALAHPEWHMFGVVAMWVSGTALALLTFNQIWPGPLDAVIARVGSVSLARAERAPRDLIPLKEAARELLEAAPRSAFVLVGRRMNPDPDELLNFLAIHMVGRGLPVWGRLPPSTAFEAIEFLNMRAGHVTHGATTLTWGLDDKPGYVDLAVRRSDLKRLWAAFLANIG